MPQGLRSEDGGLTFQPSLTSPGRVVPSGARDALFIAEDGTQIRRSTDAGRTWTPFTLDDDLVEVHGAASCPPPSSCLYALYSNTSSPFATALKRSSDGGRTWSAGLPVPDQLFFHPDALNVAPDDDRHLVGAGGLGLAETRDGGMTWTSQAVDTGSVALLGDGALVVSSTFRGIPPHVTVRSTDDGVTWTEVEPFSGTLFTSPARPGTVYLIADGVYRSTDQCATWERVSPASLPSSILALADAPGGKLVAAMDGYGLVSFE
jgi:hypothetical protein